MKHEQWIRKFRVYYASNMWSGYCISRESAIIAATKRLVDGIYTYATIYDRETGEDVARLRMSRDRKHVTITGKNIFEERSV